MGKKEYEESRRTIHINVNTFERLFRRKENPKDSIDSVIVRLLDKDIKGGRKDHAAKS